MDDDMNSFHNYIEFNSSSDDDDDDDDVLSLLQGNIHNKSWVKCERRYSLNRSELSNLLKYLIYLILLI